MLTITTTETKADDQTAAAAVSAAKTICENLNMDLEIANPPAVVLAPDGSVKVMCWMVIDKEDL